MNYKIYLLPLLMINNFYTAQEKLIDDIVAKINDVPILYSDIQNIINSMKYTKEANKINEGKKIEILNELIEQNLVISSNPKISIEKEEKMIKDNITKQAYAIFDKYFHNNEENFIKELGCNVEDYIKIGIENQKKQMLYMRIIEDLCKEKIFSQEDIQKAYTLLKKQKQLPQIEEYFEIYEIQLLQKESKEVFEKAKGIREQLKNKEWEEIVKSLSKDERISTNIDQEWHTLGDLEDKFEYVVFNLKIGEISDVVKINDGYYIIKLLDLDEIKYKTAIIFFPNNIYSSNEEEAFKDLRKIKNNIILKKISWEQAVTKRDISKEIKNVLKNIKEGEISEPFVEKNNDENIYKIIYLKKHVKKHIANLQEDFNLIENLIKKIYQEKQKKIIVQNFYKNANIKLNKHHKICEKWEKIYNTTLQKDKLFFLVKIFNKKEWKSLNLIYNVYSLLQFLINKYPIFLHIMNLGNLNAITNLQHTTLIKLIIQFLIYFVHLIILDTILITKTIATTIITKIIKIKIKKFTISVIPPK